MNYYQAVLMRKRWIKKSDSLLIVVLACMAITLVLRGHWTMYVAGAMALIALLVKIAILVGVRGLDLMIENGRFDEEDQAA